MAGIDLTAWGDWSGNGRDLDSVSGTPVLVDESGIAGIDFENADDENLYRTTGAKNSYPFALFAVLRFESTGGIRRIMAQHNSDARNDAHYIHQSAGIAAGARATTDVNTPVHGDTASTVNRQVIIGRFDADNNRTVYVDDDSTGVNSTDNAGVAEGSHAYITVGGQWPADPDGGYDGVIYEAGILNAWPSPYQLAQMQEYWKLRYAIPGIP